jgi:site-specific recombinase XerD
MDHNLVDETMHRLKRERHWTPSTFNSYRKNANTYILFLIRKGIIEKNPIKKIEKVRERKKRYEIPDQKDITKLLAYFGSRNCSSPMQRARDLLFIQMLRFTGARPVELLSLSLENVADRKNIYLY